MKSLGFIFCVTFFLNINCLYSEKSYYKGDCIYHQGFDDLDTCLNKELTEYDKDLNVLYRKLTVSPVNKNKLKKAEMLWIKFKEADCDYMASEVNGGKEYNDIYTACLINRTKERISDLTHSLSFLKWFRGRID